MRHFLSILLNVLSFGVPTIIKWLAKRTRTSRLQLDLDRDGSPDVEIHILAKSESTNLRKEEE